MVWNNKLKLLPVAITTAFSLVSIVGTPLLSSFSLLCIVSLLLEQTARSFCPVNFSKRQGWKLYLRLSGAADFSSPGFLVFFRVVGFLVFWFPSSGVSWQLFPVHWVKTDIHLESCRRSNTSLHMSPMCPSHTQAFRFFIKMHSSALSVWSVLFQLWKFCFFSQGLANETMEFLFPSNSAAFSGAFPKCFCSFWRRPI